MSQKRKTKPEIEVELLNPEHELPKQVQCKKCKRKVDNTKAAKWEHAAKFHTDMFLRMLQDKIFTNNRGTDGLYDIGYGLGKQMQADGVTGGTLLGMLKGLKRNG